MKLAAAFALAASVIATPALAKDISIYNINPALANTLNDEICDPGVPSTCGLHNQIEPKLTALGCVYHRLDYLCPAKAIPAVRNLRYHQ